MILIFRMEAIKNGESTPIMDKIVFKKIRALLGGQMRLMLCGGAPLSKEVHDFMRVCIGAPLLQVSFHCNLYIFIKTVMMKFFLKLYFFFTGLWFD